MARKFSGLSNVHLMEDYKEIRRRNVVELNLISLVGKNNTSVVQDDVIKHNGPCNVSKLNGELRPQIDVNKLPPAEPKVAPQLAEVIKVPNEYPPKNGEPSSASKATINITCVLAQPAPVARPVGASSRAWWHKKPPLPPSRVPIFMNQPTIVFPRHVWICNMCNRKMPTTSPMVRYGLPDGNKLMCNDCGYKLTRCRKRQATTCANEKPDEKPKESKDEENDKKGKKFKN